MSKIFRYILIFSLLLSLVAIRYFQEFLFYDPLTQFFKQNHSTQPLPEFLSLKMYVNIFLRYFLNTIISLVLLWLIFKKKGIIEVSTILYGSLFIILFIIYILIIETSGNGTEHIFLFYVRRFLIQPLFLFILLPAFYFQRKK